MCGRTWARCWIKTSNWSPPYNAARNRGDSAVRYGPNKNSGYAISTASSIATSIAKNNRAKKMTADRLGRLPMAPAGLSIAHGGAHYRNHGPDSGCLRAQQLLQFLLLLQGVGQSPVLQ